MIKKGSAGGYDDDQFRDEELLYRRVPKKPDFLTLIDPVTGERRPTPAAFSIGDDEPDGLSVSIRTLILRHRLKTGNLCKNWETHGVARFRVGVLRPDTGIIEDPTDDPLIGKAHGLIRAPNGKPARAVWNEVRNKILKNVEYFEADPEPIGAAAI